MTCRSPVATPPCAKHSVEKIRMRQDKVIAFKMRIIRFSLGLADASRRRERFPRQVADVITKDLKRFAARWFL